MPKKEGNVAKQETITLIEHQIEKMPKLQTIIFLLNKKYFLKAKLQTINYSGSNLVTASAKNQRILPGLNSKLVINMQNELQEIYQY